jgi:hypothetical protein
MSFLPQVNFVATDIFIKLRIVLLAKHLAAKKNECASRLLAFTLKDIETGISHTSQKRIDAVKTILKECLVFIYLNHNEKAIKQLCNAGQELDVDDLVRRKMVTRDSCGDLDLLPFDIREKIASFV